MKTAHLPGPWQLAWGKNGIVACPGGVVCIIGNHNPEDGKAPTRKANGQLIAAAPELESALRVLVDHLRRVEHWPVTAEHMAYLAAAEQALAKAEGR